MRLSSVKSVGEIFLSAGHLAIHDVVYVSLILIVMYLNSNSSL